MSLIENDKTKERIWCARCYGRGRRVSAEHDIEGDYPLCEACKTGVKTPTSSPAPASVSSSESEPSPQSDEPKEPQTTHRAVVRQRVGRVQAAHTCECKPDCKTPAIGKFARGHYPRELRIHAGNKGYHKSHPEHNVPPPEKPNRKHKHSSNGSEPIPELAIELLSPDEYNQKYKVYRYAAPDIIALVKYLDSMPFEKVAVIKPNGGETPGGLCDRIRRTFDKWYAPNREYKIDVGQENRESLNHVRITKIEKGTMIRKKGKRKVWTGREWLTNCGWYQGRDDEWFGKKGLWRGSGAHHLLDAFLRDNNIGICGEPAGDLIAGASYFACMLPKGHVLDESDPLKGHRRGGDCVRHGRYIGEQCPEWPKCMIVDSMPAQRTYDAGMSGIEENKFLRFSLIESSVKAGDRILLEGANGSVEELAYLTASVAAEWADKVLCMATSKLLSANMERRKP